MSILFIMTTLLMKFIQFSLVGRIKRSHVLTSPYLLSTKVLVLSQSTEMIKMKIKDDMTSWIITGFIATTLMALWDELVSRRHVSHYLCPSTSCLINILNMRLGLYSGLLLTISLASPDSPRSLGGGDNLTMGSLRLPQPNPAKSQVHLRQSSSVQDMGFSWIRCIAVI